MTPFYVLDGEDDDHLWAMGSTLNEMGVESIPALARPPESQYHVADDTHRWDEATFDHIARNKDRLIEKALDEGYTHMLFVDSDLLLEPTTIYSMLRAQSDLVSACFWTHWNDNDNDSLGPNVWLRHPYGQTGLGMKSPEFWHRLATRRITTVAGGGACMLMNRTAMERGLRYYPRIPDLPDHGMYRGEDRSFCIRAKRMHLSHACDPWPDIFHAYHKWQRRPEAVDGMVAELQTVRRNSPLAGDLVNFTITALEDPDMLDSPMSVRGRLGGLEVLPEIEVALGDMAPGEQKILNLRYPLYWPELGGEQRMVELELVDVKEWGFAPNLVDHVARGLEPPDDYV